MPAGPGQHIYDEQSYTHEYHNNTSREMTELNGGPDESAASILQSVKEQEAQFEQLTRELEAERQSVANQLERCKLGSETASMSSISSTDESFHWRAPPPQHEHIDEESDADSKMSGSQLVDSCLRVLQERGLMNVGEDPVEYLGEDPGAPPRPPPSSEHYRAASAIYGSAPTVNYGSAPAINGLHRHNDSSNHSLHSAQSNNSINRSHQQLPISPQVVASLPLQQQAPGGSESPLPQENPYSTYSHYSPYQGSQNNLPPPSPAQRSRSPASSQGRGTPTRLTSHEYLPDMDVMHRPDAPNGRPEAYDNVPQYSQFDSFDQQFSYRDSTYAEPREARGDPQRLLDNGSYANPRFDDPYRATPPMDDSYRHNDSFQGQDPYGDIPHIDEAPTGPPPPLPPEGDRLYQDDRYSEERYPPRGDDPYQDARPPTNDRYNHRPYPDDRQRGTPSPSAGPVGYGDPDPYGSHSRLEGPRTQYIDDHDPYNLNNNKVPYTPNNKGSFTDDRPHYNGDDSRDQPYIRVDDQIYDRASRDPYQTDEDPYGRADRDPNLLSQSQRGPYDPEEERRSYQDLSRPYDPEEDRQSYQGSRGPYEQDGEPYINPDPQGFYDPDDHRPPYDDDQGSYRDHRNGPYNPDFADELDTPQQVQHLGAPPGEYDADPLRRSPSINSEQRGVMPFPDQKWRNPDLPEVIDFLSHPSNAIKANAAAYLQHLCYMDDSIKAKTKSLGGIPALVELVNNEIPEVHRAASGALRNLSYGKSNDDNKRAIKNAGGIPALVRLLRKSPDNDVRELVTGILWNLSSCQDLKKPIIDDGLVVMISNVIIPHSGWDRNLAEEGKRPRDVYWSTVFRNASGVLRNISSDGEYARKKLRECEGLVDSIFFIVRGAIGKNDIDNKSVENCVCILRNLSYACQEVDDPQYLRRRADAKAAAAKGESTGCFGGNKKKKEAQKLDQRGRSDSGYQSRPRTEPARGMELLWQPDVVHVYLPLLSDCSNPETLEAAAGAIQNLAACEWQPSVDVRAAIRKERGLPIIVELLLIEADRVVCAAATALRNLALDHRNKELIGKYAMRQLVTKLPSENRPPDFPVSDDTITAVQATLYEVIKKNADFAQSLLNEGGVERLVFINGSRGKFSSKVVKFASSILYTMWQFKELHAEYKNRGWKEQHFVSKTMAMRGGPSPSANNTLNRPRMDLGGSGVRHSEPTQRAPPQTHVGNSVSGAAHPNSYMDDPTRTPNTDRYPERDERLRPEDIPMNNMGAAELPSPGYATIESQRAPPRDRQDYRPPGGVPLFPNLPPSSQQPQPLVDASREPLYAQVNKHSKRRQDGTMMLDGGPPPPDGGADSWV